MVYLDWFPSDIRMGVHRGYLLFFSEYHKKFSSRVMKTFKFSLVLCTRENTDIFITFDDNIYGIHIKRVNILYVLQFEYQTGTSLSKPYVFFHTVFYTGKAVSL